MNSKSGAGWPAVPGGFRCLEQRKPVGSRWNCRSTGSWVVVPKLNWISFTYPAVALQFLHVSILGFGTASIWINTLYIELRIVYLPRFSSAPNDPLVPPLPSGGTPKLPILNSGLRIASSLINENSDYLLAMWQEH